MSALDDIRKALAIPAGFGPDAPYARFSRTQDDGAAGEDITLEYQTGDTVTEPPLVVFSHTEWQLVAGAVRTRPLCTATIDADSGAPLAGSAAASDELAERIREALTHADQLVLVD